MSDNVPPTMGRRIADARERRGWTQKKLADEAKISVTFLSEVENDRRAIGSTGLLAVADALGASVDYLLKGSVGAPRPQAPLVIPPELAEAADEQGWSLAETRDLMKFHQMVVARRGQAVHADKLGRQPTKEEWLQSHDRLFGDGSLG
jgi:transcriptional regulator with XRE-family HTH domain